MSEISVLSNAGIIYEIGRVVLFHFENKAARKAGKNAEKPRGWKNRIRRKGGGSFLIKGKPWKIGRKIKTITRPGPERFKLFIMFLVFNEISMLK